MSYDLYFLRREPGQSWEAAMEALEAQSYDEGGFDTEIWNRLISHARELLGDIDVFEDPPSWEISHEPTGLELSCVEGQWTLSVPYWTHDEQAQRVVETMRLLALAVERETGLECYDPQLDLALSEIPLTDTTSAVAIFNRVAERFGRR